MNQESPACPGSTTPLELKATGVPYTVNKWNFCTYAVQVKNDNTGALVKLGSFPSGFDSWILPNPPEKPAAIDPCRGRCDRHAALSV